MAMRVIDAGKSKYYTAAIENLLAAKNLYHTHGQEQAWQSVVARLRTNHSRKHFIMAALEDIIAGRTPRAVESFADRMRKRWHKQTSGGTPT